MPGLPADRFYAISLYKAEIRLYCAIDLPINYINARVYPGNDNSRFQVMLSHSITSQVAVCENNLGKFYA